MRLPIAAALALGLTTLPARAGDDLVDDYSRLLSSAFAVAFKCPGSILNPRLFAPSLTRAAGLDRLRELDAIDMRSIETGARERMGLFVLKGKAHCDHLRAQRIPDPANGGRDIPIVLTIEPPPT